MPEQTRPVFIDGFYEKLVEGGINYFFPSATLQVIEAGVEPAACCMTDSSDQTSLILTWLGSRYSLTRNEAFSAQELKLLKGIGAVLDSRYRMIADTDRTEQRSSFFGGSRRIDMFQPPLMVPHTYKTSGKDRTGRRYD